MIWLVWFIVIYTTQSKKQNKKMVLCESGKLWYLIVLHTSKLKSNWADHQSQILFSIQSTWHGTAKSFTFSSYFELVYWLQNTCFNKDCLFKLFKCAVWPPDTLTQKKTNPALFLCEN